MHLLVRITGNSDASIFTTLWFKNKVTIIFNDQVNPYQSEESMVRVFPSHWPMYSHKPVCEL